MFEAYAKAKKTSKSKTFKKHEYDSSCSSDSEKCSDHLYLCRESGQPHTLMALLHDDPSSYNK